MALTRTLRREKLARLVELAGFASSDELLASVVTDSVSPGICTMPRCDYTTEVEPDQDRAWCEVCEDNTVASALVLAGLV